MKGPYKSILPWLQRYCDAENAEYLKIRGAEKLTHSDLRARIAEYRSYPETSMAHIEWCECGVPFIRYGNLFAGWHHPRCWDCQRGEEEREKRREDTRRSWAKDPARTKKWRALSTKRQTERRRNHAAQFESLW